MWSSSTLAVSVHSELGTEGIAQHSLWCRAVFYPLLSTLHLPEQFLGVGTTTLPWYNKVAFKAARLFLLWGYFSAFGSLFERELNFCTEAENMPQQAAPKKNQNKCGCHLLRIANPIFLRSYISNRKEFSIPFIYTWVTSSNPRHGMKGLNLIWSQCCRSQGVSLYGKWCVYWS